MSAFVVGTEHIDYLVEAAIVWGHRDGLYYDGQRCEFDRADAIGTDLLRVNIVSVAYRYPDCALEELPGPIPTPRPCEYRHTQPRRKLEAVQLLKAIMCYEYQSCEHAGWKTSAAKKFCEGLTQVAIGKLPGWDGAEWEIVD